MGHLRVADVGVDLPDGRRLLDDVSFLVSSGECVALVGANGAGKSTLLRTVARPDQTEQRGSVVIDGTLLYMAQDVGQQGGVTVRSMLLDVTPSEVRETGIAIREANLAASRGDVDAGMRLGDLYERWANVGGYEWEARWDEAAREVTGRPFPQIADVPAAQLSGGERKRMTLTAMLQARADILVMDEPDNFLDIPAKEWLEQELSQSAKCILLVSHDRQLLATVPDKLVTLEGGGAWVHAGNYSDYEKARTRRQEDREDELKRWHTEERRLFQHYRTMKQRAALNAKNAPKGDAAETRWKKFAEVGPPPPPVKTRQIATRLTGANSGERVLTCTRMSIPGLVAEFDAELFRGDRVGLVGPNGSGKSHLLRAFDSQEPAIGFKLGARVTTGYFTQGGEPEFERAKPLRVVLEGLAPGEEAVRAALGRYGLGSAYDQSFQSLSGGEKARVEILMLELTGANLLLLDEPTDNLDIGSAEALEAGLMTLTGTVVAVSHDRRFLAACSRYLLLDHRGRLFEVSRYDDAIELLRQREVTPRKSQARLLTVPGARAMSAAVRSGGTT